MVKGSTVVTWSEAVKGFYLHKKATRSPNTAIYYRKYATRLLEWADAQSILLSEFTKRHLDQYLVYRADQGRAENTVRHSALVATVFTEWCYKNDLLHRDPLTEYKIRAAAETEMYFPTQEEMKRLINAILSFYEVSKNSNMRECSPTKRSFHRDRNFAIELTKVDTACRIGEVMDFKLSNFQEFQTGSWQLTVTHSKGRKTRALPLSKVCSDAILDWLKVRKRVMKAVLPGEDEGWLFISEAGTRINEGNYLRGLKKLTFR